MSSLRVDHVIYAVDDLEAAGERFAEEFGLASVEGGRHPDWGTANRIVPLGSAYVELVAVVDPQVAASSDFGRPVLDAVAIHEPLVGWVIATPDVRGIAHRLDLDVGRGSRMKPDGTTLSWQLAGVAPALDAGALPFFIEWGGPPTHHPGRAKAEHHVTPSGIAWVQVAYDEDSLRRWLGEDVDVRLLFVDGPARLSAVAVNTEAGEIVLR
jgi:Glyoxalase-like domain